MKKKSMKKYKKYLNNFVKNTNRYIKNFIERLKTDRVLAIVFSINVLLFMVVSIIVNLSSGVIAIALVGGFSFYIFTNYREVKPKTKNESKGDVIMAKKKKNNTKKKQKQTSSPKSNNKFKNFIQKLKDKGIFRKAVVGVLILGIVGVLTGFAFIGYIVATAPDFDPDNMVRAEASILLDSSGAEITRLGAERREKISFDDMPDVLLDAIIATEDSRFFQHNGIDLPRFTRAVIGQAMGRNAGGGSTLTMQVSKNNYTSVVATGFEGVKRKFTDIYMSIFEIERNYTKEEIIEFYINQPYLGGGAYGVEQASQTYFNKSARDLNLSESALIAGLFQAPGAFDPFINPEAAQRRRSTVLYLMERHGYITKEEREMANAIPVEDLLTTRATGGEFQGFVDTVVEDVIKKTGFDPYIVSMNIHTTMDRSVQSHINNIMNGEGFNWENEAVNSGVAVVDVNTGAIKGIGAGRNRTGQRQFNTATMIKRHIGSTSKPFYAYAPGIEYNNWSTYHLFVDEPHTYTSGTEIRNWDGQFEGLQTMRTTLSRSRNIPALKAFQANTNRNIREMATGLGLSPEISGNIVHEAHALGGYNGESPLSMAIANAAFANGGFYVEPHSFTKIEYRQSGEEFVFRPEKERVMSEETAYMVANMLVDAANYGLGRNSNINNAVYGAKTGTSNFDRETMNRFNFPRGTVNDRWVAGTSPDYGMAVWYGYERANPDFFTNINNRQHVMLYQALGRGIFKSNSTFERPDGVIRVAVERESWPAKLPSENTPSNMIVTELFKEGTEPTEVSDRYKKLPTPSNLDINIQGNRVNVSWDRIETPKAYDESALDEYFRSLYTNSSRRASAKNSRLAYNRSNIGDLGYNVYAVGSNGNRTLLGFTTNNAYEANLVNGTTKIEVTAAFSIFRAAESDAISKDVDRSLLPIIEASLNGGSEIKLEVGQTYVEDGVRVIENGSDVTSKASINRTVTKNGDTVPNVTTNEPATFTIKYEVKYKSIDRTLERIVIVE